MELPTYFNDFLANIRLGQVDRTACIAGHTRLSELLKSDPKISDGILVATFLQGSYRRSTIVRPGPDKKPDVDVVVVTRLDRIECSPRKAQDIFCEFLDRQDDYKRTYERQGRSIGIKLETVDLDLVVTSAPSESQEGFLQSDSVSQAFSLEDVGSWALNADWPAPSRSEERSYGAYLEKALAGEVWNTEPLYIPDRDINTWEPTDPLSQINWTHEKNLITNGHYINVVKAVKWWRQNNSTSANGRPKGYLVEHIFGMNCPDRLSSVAHGITETLENIRSAYHEEVLQGTTPWIPDHRLPGNNVFKRISAAEFAEFYYQVRDCASECREALNDQDINSSARKWREIFGDSFPAPPNNGDGNGNNAPLGPTKGFAEPSRPASPRRSTFA